MDFNLILKDLRREKKITQAIVAEHLSISVSTYTKYETAVNQPDFNMLIKISKLFGVSTDYLLGLSSLKSPYPILKKSEKNLLKLYDSLSEQGKGKLQERAKMLLEEELIYISEKKDSG